MIFSLLEQRLTNHWLVYNNVKSPFAVVQQLLCMQAQDRKQHAWAIWSRTRWTVSDIEKAYNDWLLVRTRTQRGTIHTICAEDAWWMVWLCAKKTLWWFPKRRTYLGISDAVLDKALSMIEQYLSTWPKSRSEIGTYLTEWGVVLQSWWIYHLLCYAGTLWITVQWPVVDGEQLFVLSQQRIKNAKQLTDEEALKELCVRYFSSHGPATIDDLQRWSGLWKTQIKQWIALSGDFLQEVILDWTVYYVGSETVVEQPFERVYALAWFDEWLLWYKDRTATLALEHHTWVDVSRNGIFKPTVMIDGQTVGIWTVKEKKNVVEITIQPFKNLSVSQKKLLQNWFATYKNYLEKEINVLLP